MFLCVLKIVVLIFFVYGLYSFIMLIFDKLDEKKYKRCVYVDSRKVSDLESALYSALMRYPDTEIFIIYSEKSDENTKNIISSLCKTYDLVFSIEEREADKI